MNDATRRMLTAWLDDESAERRDHARGRLATAGAGADRQGPPRRAPAKTPPVPLADALHAQKYGGLRCWFAEATPGCGCAGFRCHLLGRDGVTLRDCIACLRPR